MDEEFSVFTSSEALTSTKYTSPQEKFGKPSAHRTFQIISNIVMACPAHFPDFIVVCNTDYDEVRKRCCGAGGESRTLVTSLENLDINRYTTPALLYNFISFGAKIRLLGNENKFSLLS